MAAKKKTKKRNQTKSKSKRVAGKKKVAVSKTATKRKTSKKSPRNKKAAQSKPVTARPNQIKKIGAKAVSLSRKRAARTRQSLNRASSPGSRDMRSGQQSGDLQGLSNVERADSESVDELLEEGNAFEADVVAGVEEADNADQREVHTHEVPEDDVPKEYLDEES